MLLHRHSSTRTNYPYKRLSLHRCRIKGRHWRKPLLRARMSSAGQLVERALQFARNRTRLAAPNGAEVDLSQSDHLGCGSADKYLVRNIELITGDRFFKHGVSHVACNRDEAIAGDAFQDWAARYCVDDAVAHHKKILAGALRDIAGRIEHDRFVETQPLGLSLHEDRSHVVSRNLCLRHHDVWMESRKRRNVRSNPAFLCLLAKECLPFPNRDQELRLPGIDHHAHGAVEVDQRSDVTGREAVRSNYLMDCLRDLFF